MSDPKNFHAGSRSSQAYLYDVDVPTPSHAERARTLAASLGQGTLATLGHPDGDAAGFPFGSLVKVALDDGHPVVLISGLAEHTKNLKADPRGSVLLTENGEANPLALGRITLVGQLTNRGQDERGTARAAYLGAHPDTEYYLNYGDFGFWRMQVQSIRYIGGFGRMSWVSLDAWLAAEPDPLAEAAAGIIDHMNEDHAENMREMCLAFTEASEFSEVKMTGVDRYGFEMSIHTQDGWRPIRLPFKEAVNTPKTVRSSMVQLVQEARARAAASS